MFIFVFLNLNVVFTLNVLKMASVRVRFSPEFSPVFLSGAGFPGEQSAQAWFYNSGGSAFRSAISARGLVRLL
jgi:hypothetical protein